MEVDSAGFKEDLSPIRSERLALIPLAPEVIETLLKSGSGAASDVAGYQIPAHWPGHEAGFLKLRLGQMRNDPSWRQWLVRAVLLRADGQMIGHAGFHDPPRKGGKLELGYTIFPAFRRQGYATEAARALMDWAKRTHGIRRFVASVSPTNEPSLAVVRRLGFVRTGVQWDEEDGEEIVFELELPQTT
jgi:ribosomal-protein-alanine N-acetyltransferase